MKYDAIVIGSGIGGLSTALLLTNQGRKTLLLEKNDSLGGRLRSYHRDGFTVDLGVHIISRCEKGPLGEILSRAKVVSKLKFEKVRPVSSYDGKIFIFPHDLKDMMPEKDFDGLMKFMSDIRAMTDNEVSGYDNVTIKSVLNKYTENPLAHSCLFNISMVYTCLSSWLLSAGELMRCLRYEAEARASGYPIGGCGTIVQELAEAIRERGGDIIANTPVEKILIKDNKVTGVITNDNEYAADIIVSNADIKHTILNLAGESYFDNDYVEYVKILEYSWAGPVVRVALDAKISDIKMLTQFGSLDQEEYYRSLQAGIMPPELNLFLVSPSNFSPEAAPDGKQLINITTPIPLDLPQNILDALPQAMMKTVEKYIPDIKEHILWTEYTSISDLSRDLGECGASIGIGQRVGQVGKDRPAIKTSVNGLYIVGGESGGTGVGTELAMNSALELIDNYIF